MKSYKTSMHIQQGFYKCLQSLLDKVHFFAKIQLSSIVYKTRLFQGETSKISSQ